VSAPAAKDTGEVPFFSLANAWSWIKVLVLILFIKGCVIDQYTVPTGSMEPTIKGDPGFFKGDRILVNKFLLGPRIPFTSIRLWEWAQPKRWDIVVFRPLKEQSEFPILVKRIVALPGERVKITYGHIEINGEKVTPGETVPEGNEWYNAFDIAGFRERATDPYWREHWDQLLKRYPLRYGCSDEDQYAVVPEGHYFCIGDNSADSIDGRVWGWVPAERILGPVFGIWWPLSHRRDFVGFTKTWWGQGLLYGIPALIITYELGGYWLDRRRKRQRAEDSANAPPPASAS